MSMNVYIVAEREVQVNIGGKIITDIQCTRFDAVQTPTKVTYDIVKSENPLEAYIDYVKSRSSIQKVPVYAPDDIFGEREPIRFEDYDWSTSHIEGFRAWVVEMTSKGYEIKFEVT